MRYSTLECDALAPYRDLEHDLIDVLDTRTRAIAQVGEEPTDDDDRLPFPRSVLSMPDIAIVFVRMRTLIRNRHFAFNSDLHYAYQARVWRRGMGHRLIGDKVHGILIHTLCTLGNQGTVIYYCGAWVCYLYDRLYIN